MLICSFFSSLGKVYRLKAYEIPEASRHARGTAIVNLLPLEKGETIAAVIATKDFPRKRIPYVRNSIRYG